MPQPVGNDPLEGCYDTELLDSILGAKETATGTVTREASTGTGPLVTPAKTASGPGHPEEFSSTFSRFMIGGSLFSRCRTAAVAAASKARLRRAYLSWLDYGSIYCPFTRQFVSLRSPHWTHLVEAGFGIDTSLRHGRGLDLVSPWKLKALACDLQKQEEDRELPDSLENKGRKCPLVKWSCLLRQSLGVLLETTPAEDSNALVRRVREVLREESLGRTSRRIPLSFCDTVLGKRSTFAWTGGGEKTPNDTVDDEAYSKSVMTFGERCLQQRLPWRALILQRRQKVTLQESVIPALGPTVVSAANTTEKGKTAALIEGYSSLNSTPFLIPNTRLAYLSTPYDPEVPLVEIVVNALLRTIHSEEVFYCPLEHCVDYSSLMDLEAFRVRPSMCGSPKLEESVSPLHLGMHADTSKDASHGTVVLISNAHLLSRRAIARLLDQWTRNGVANSARCLEPRGIARIRRELLLHAGEPMGSIGEGVSLFGGICALFVGYRPAYQHNRGLFDGTGCEDVACIRSDDVSVRVLPPMQEPVFFLDEPLVAALRRVAPIFQRTMTGVEQRSFIEELCDAATGILPCFAGGSKNLGAAGKSDGASSGATVEHEEDFLHQLPEAFESFLSHPVSRGGVSLLPYEEILLRYPTFSSMRVRHELLREYPLSVELKGDGYVPIAAATPSLSVSQCAEHHVPPVKRHSVVLESRRLALECADAEHNALKKSYAIGAVLRRVAHAPTNGCSFSSVLPCTTDSAGCSQQLFEQTYEPLFEPPVLLGRWTHTLLFCAPMVADVLPLRRLLELDVAAAVQNTRKFEILDVDVFHIDYVAYPPDRRCRLFGARLRFTAASGSNKCARRAATAALQHALAKNAVEARLFPLWTSGLSPTRRSVGGGDSTDANAIPRDCGSEGNRFVAHFHFETLDECMSAAQPDLVERRLFALAVAQRGRLRLTVGTKVVVLQNLSPCIARGSWCRVVGFVPMSELAQSASFLTSKQQKQNGSAADILLAHRFFEHQKGSSALPVVRPLLDDSEETADVMEEVVLPAPMLVGGYRSLHYYALPTAQLPLLAPCHCVAASTLFHPFFAHEDSLMEFVSTTSRREALTMMLHPPAQAPSARDGMQAYAFMEDTVFEGREMTEEAEGWTNSQALRVVHCSVLSALSLFPLKRP